MPLLVADVGGTNTRVALVRDGHRISGLRRYQNDDFGSFDAVLVRYTLDQGLPSALAGCCIAVAGPVTSTQAKLTNRGWTFDAAAIAATLGAGRVHLINDLAALGYSLPDLGPDQLSVLRASRGAGTLNTQSLVVGMGTGFNICVVKATPGGPVVVEAELGHACLPASVARVLEEALGTEAAQFATIEDLLSGRGLSQVYSVRSGGDEKGGAQILAAYDPQVQDPIARTTELIARLLGLLSRELVFQYLPFGGIHFAGGVARGVLGSAAQPLFLEALNTPGPFAEHVALVPILLITDDAAALIGAARSV